MFHARAAPDSGTLSRSSKLENFCFMIRILDFILSLDKIPDLPLLSVGITKLFDFLFPFLIK
ncbi:MAG: hypothetical protein A3F83_12935 [Candidatus Glassbacteria bacterium RIFCSPLOWO2_12_FULL_58_11]|uniref:Uncharacterized protein n=1 Tax=Candidatus Glassbacteria bacterium RIFCSPLOWO2_12_FULL_58_11 TaxID=1817867 RepID=A0A1F5YYV9_9BACT|nr:MAG: hypothetical protein A3F83_12935 [Candidatus Glassbacteria bacterium RIFCSPLOWO2_12_FULL_58_11]